MPLGALGIIDTQYKDDISVAYGYYDEESARKDLNLMLEVRVRVSEDKIVAADFDGLRAGNIVEETKYYAPKGSKVTFRGELLAPTGHMNPSKRFEIYILKDMRTGAGEKIIVDFGGLIGVMEDWIVTGKSDFERSIAPNAAYGNYSTEQRPTVYTNYRALRVTNPKYGDRYNEITETVNGFIQTIKKLLYDNDIDAFYALTTSYENIPGRVGHMGARNSGWRNGWNSWQKADASDKNPWKVRFKEWKVEIGDIEFASVETLIADCTVTLMEDGKPKYTQKQNFWFRQVDGEWKISFFQGSIGLFSRSVKDWKLVE
jgi:hypothetical protein